MKEREEPQEESREETLNLSRRATQLLEGIGDSGTHTQRAEAISIAQAWATLATVMELQAISEKFTTFEATMTEMIKEMD